MRMMFLLLVIVSSCFSSTTASAEFSAVDLTAKRIYGPSKWEDGTYKTSPSGQLAKIPAFVLVTSGSAALGKLTVSFDSLVCTYRGDASKGSLRLSNPGKNYLFESCSPNESKGLIAQILTVFEKKYRDGQEVFVKNKIVVHVHSGDGPSDTLVRASILVDRQKLPTDEIQFTSPVNGTVPTDRTVQISGKISSLLATTSLKLISGPFEVQIAPDKSFSVERLLAPGVNDLSFSLMNGESVIATNVLTLEFVPPIANAKKILAASGGEVEITDETNPLEGSKVIIPAGALNRDIYAYITNPNEGEEVVPLPDIPIEYIQVGPAPVFQPIAESFLKDVTYIVPFDPARIPADESVSQVKILALKDAGWVPVSFSRSGNFLSHVTNESIFTSLVAVVEKTLPAGVLLVDVPNVNGVSFYIDGVKAQELASGPKTGIALGTHTLKLYAPGFNETFVHFEMREAAGSFVRRSLQPQGERVPIVNIDSSIPDGIETSLNLITIRGNVLGLVGRPELSTGIISVNEKDTYFAVDMLGNFETVVPLIASNSNLQLRVTDSANAGTGLSRTIRVNQVSAPEMATSARPTSRNRISSSAPPSYEVLPARSKKALQKRESLPKSTSVETSSRMSTLSTIGPVTGASIRAVLTWSSPGTDVDLRMSDQYGNLTWYNNMYGVPGSALDVDNTWGYGPEVISLPSAPAGLYPIGVHYYDSSGMGPTTATVTVIVDGVVVFQSSATLGHGQYWNPYVVNISSKPTLRLVGVTNLLPSYSATHTRCDALVGSNCEYYRFTTTLTGTDIIAVQAQASANVPDSEIKYRIREVGSGLPVNTGVGRNVQFAAISPVPQSAYPPVPRYSAPLTYEVVAYLDIGIQSDPIYIVQDLWSQVRQEYIDVKRIHPDFMVVPGFDSIVYASDPELSGWSDFARTGFAIVGKNTAIRQRVRAAYSFEARVTSSWRNPKRNAAQKGELNSKHQYGSAVDFGATHEKANWPGGATRYIDALHYMKRMADPYLADLNCSTRVHDAGSGDHYHVGCR